MDEFVVETLVGFGKVTILISVCALVLILVHMLDKGKSNKE